MWIDIYVGPPDVIVTDANTNFTAVEFRTNAQAMAIKIEDVPVEAHNSIGKAERYHYTLKRAYNVIAVDLWTTVTPGHILQMAIKSINDTADPQGLVPNLLVFGTYPQLTELSPLSPSITVRTNAIRKAMTEVPKTRATRQVSDGFSMRNGPNISETIQLPLQSEIKFWRENIGWTGPHILLARSDNDVTCTVDVNGKVVNFRTVSVKPYHRDDTTNDVNRNESAEENADSKNDDNDEYVPPRHDEQVQRKRGRPKGSKNALKQQAVENIANTI